MRRRLPRFLAGGFVLVLVLFGILLLLPLFLNPTYLKDRAFAHIQQTFGPHIRVGDTSLSLFPYPHVELSEVIVKEQPDAHAFFRAKFISLDLELLPLLQQKFSVKELLIEHPEIEIKRDREGEWSMFQGSKNEKNEPFIATIVLMDKVDIFHGQITFIDESPREEARGVVLEDVNVSIESLESSTRSAEVRASGKIRGGLVASDFFWDGFVDFGYKTDPIPEAEVPNTYESVEVSGDFKVLDLDIRQISELFYPERPLMIDMGLARINSHIVFTPGQVGYEMILSELSVESDHGTFSGNANITGLLTNDWTIFVGITSTPVSVKTVQQVVPREFLPKRFASVWEEAEVDGTIEVTQATIAGSTRLDVGISIVGTFQLDTNTLKYRDRIPDVTIAKGTMIVEPDRVRFSNFSGMYDDIPVQAANGLILLNESGPWLDLEVRGKVLAREVIRVITGLSDVSQSNRYLRAMNVLDGIGDLRLHFTGMLEGDPGISLADGDYDAQGVIFDVPNLDSPITIRSGRIGFTQYELRLDEISGQVGESQFRIHGHLKPGKRAIVDSIKIQADLQDRFVNQIVSRNFAMSVPPLDDGTATLQAELSGFLDSPKITGKLDLQGSAIRIPGIIEKKLGVASDLTFSVRHKTNGELALDQIELSIHPLTVSVRGLIRLHPTFAILARINTGPIYLGLLPDGVMVGGQILRSGILEVSMDVSGRGLELKKWRPKGWIALTEGVANIKGTNTPISNLFLRLKLTPSIAEIKRLEFRMKKSDVQVTGTVANWRDTPSIDVSLDSTNFDLNLLVPQGQQSSMRNMLEEFAGNSRLIGNIHIQNSTYKEIKAKNLRGMLKIRDGLVTLDRIRGEAFGEPVAGRIFIHLPAKKSAAIRSSFHIRGIPFEYIHRALGYHNRLVTGQFSIRGMIQGHGRDPRGVVSTLNGNMDVVIEEGVVQKGTILPRILSILNLPSLLRNKLDLRQQGFPFQKVTATLNIQDGVMTSNNLIVDSPIMKMTSAGHYDLARDELDVVAAVSPFGRYAKFLQTIPLFGRILAGERKGIATALFQVRGSISKPDVRYLPLQSFATGLTGLSQLAYDILKNIVKIPVDVLKTNRPPSENSTVSGTGTDSDPLPSR